MCNWGIKIIASKLFVYQNCMDTKMTNKAKIMITFLIITRKQMIHTECTQL